MHIQTNIAFQSMTGFGPSAWNRDTHALAADITHHYNLRHQTEHDRTADTAPALSSHKIPVTGESHH